MRRFLVLCLLILPLVVVGCSKGPAEAALKAADEAIAKVKPEAEKYVPDQFKALTDAAAAAKASFDKGDYAATLAAAKDLPAKASEVMTAASTKKDEWMGEWKGLESSLPQMVTKLTEQVNGLAAMKKLPKGFDQTQLEAAKTQLADITGMWTKATSAFAAGELTTAIQSGADVKVKAGELSGLLEAAAPAPVAKK